MKHRTIGILLACLMLCGLCGCSWLIPGSEPVLWQLTADPITGNVTYRPADPPGGLRITFETTSGEGVGWFDPGDGSGQVSVDLTGSWTHLYQQAGMFEARCGQDARIERLVITVNAPSPVNNAPFNTHGWVWDYGAIVTLDARNRSVGCDNGTPQYENGSYMPDGSPITRYFWEVTGPTKYGATIDYGIYDQRAHLITGFTSESVIRFVIGSVQSPLPLPVISLSILADLDLMTPAGCSDNECGDGDDWAPQPPVGADSNVRVTLTTVSVWGTLTTTSWLGRTSGSPCG